MSQIVAKPHAKTDVQTERPRLHKVILFNDDYTPREFVVARAEGGVPPRRGRRRSASC